MVHSYFNNSNESILLQQEYGIPQYNDNNEHEHCENLFENEQKECTNDKSKENELTLEKEKEDEETAEQLKELIKQLNYKEMYENERKRSSEVEDKLMEQYKQSADYYKQMLEKERLRNEEILRHENQVREQYKQNADKYEQILEKECLRNEELLRQNDLFQCRESTKWLFEELDKEVPMRVTAAHDKEMQERDRLMNEENLKQKALTEKLNKEIIQLKNQLIAYEKQWKGHANYCKELNTIYEKRINKAIDTFN